MKNQIILVTIALTCNTFQVFSNPVNAEETRFYCGTSFHQENSKNVPTTLVRTKNGEIPMIQWTSNMGSSAGWNPQKRCTHVSQKFQTFYEQERMNFIRTGAFNGYPVICVAQSEGGNCQENDILVTLPQNGNAQTTLTQLFAVRDRSGGVLTLSDDLLMYRDGDLYLKFDAFLSKAEPYSRQVSTPVDTDPREEKLW